MSGRTSRFSARSSLAWALNWARRGSRRSPRRPSSILLLGSLVLDDVPVLGKNLEVPADVLHEGERDVPVKWLQDGRDLLDWLDQTNMIAGGGGGAVPAAQGSAGTRHGRRSS